MTTMTSMAPEEINGAHPCRAYGGIAAAIKTFGGVEVVILAADRVALAQAVKELNPETNLNMDKCVPAWIISDLYIKHDPL
jgi:hypothetical protein